MNKAATITSLSINQFIAESGRTKQSNNFHVFKSEECNEEKSISKPVRLDHYMVILATDGACHIKSNLSDHYLEKNGLLILSPNAIFEFVEAKNIVSIGIGFIPEFFTQIGLNIKQGDAHSFLSVQNDPYFSLTDQEAASLSRIMILLYDKDHADNAPFEEQIIHHAFGVFMFELAAIVRNHRGDIQFKVTRKENIVMSFLKELPKHFKEERSVQFYARLLFITPKHLTKTVKELTNKTCGELIDEMVILEAKVLLNNFNLSISNVADHLHFSDQFIFSKFFKRITGMTPTEFRTNA